MVRRFGRRQADMKGAEKPGMEKPGMEKPGMKKPGMKKSGMMEPGMKQPGIKHSNIGRSMIRLLAATSAAAFLLTTPVYAGAWSQADGSWRYQKDDGSYARGWMQSTDGKWYYFDANGRMLTDTVTPDGYQVGPDGAWTVGGWEASYDANYPLKDYLDQAGLQYVDVIMGWNAKGESVMERRLRQDYNYGLYNYFGLSDDLCKALYGESDQIGTGEMAVDGDSLLVLGQVALYQENVGSDIYKQRRNALALVIRDYLNSYRWRDVSELERAKHAALYIASGCTYDTGLYNRFVNGEDTSGDLSFTAYGCLVNHKAVCEGISVAYQMLARSMGLNCFCAPDDNDKDHMFVYVEAGGNWYKVDLSVTGLMPQTMVDRCFKTTANQDVERIFAAYYNKANPYIAHVDYGNLAPGNVYDLSAGGLLRKYP